MTANAHVALFTIGFTRRSAEEFFGVLRTAGVRHVLDSRLRNTSQLAGFAKRDDLAFFLREIAGASYEHRVDLAPTGELLADLKAGRIDWAAYAGAFRALLAERQIEAGIAREDLTRPTALLCSEPSAERCHRRLVAEHLAAAWDGVRIVHL